MERASGHRRGRRRRPGGRGRAPRRPAAPGAASLRESWRPAHAPEPVFEEPASRRRHARMAPPPGGAARPGPLAALGPVSQRARLGDGPRGLQRRRRRLEVLPLRPRPLPRLSLERGRHGRHLRRPPDALPRASPSGTGEDPILKERIFGLDGHQGNHGEDVKEYWWYLELDPHPLVDAVAVQVPAVPRSPTSELVEENARRGRLEPEYELVDTGIFADGRYFEITVDYAKAARRTSWSSSRCATAGPETADLDVLPTLWFRNTWTWGAGHHRPEISAEGGSLRARTTTSAAAGSTACRAPSRSSATTRPTRTASGARDGPAYPKDGINDHVVAGAADREPGAAGDQGRALVPADRRRGGHGLAAAAPPRRQPGPRISARASARSWSSAAARPTSSTPR